MLMMMEMIRIIICVIVMLGIMMVSYLHYFY